MSRVWAEVLDSMQRAGLPVYVEVEPDSRAVTALLLPLVSTVEAVTADPEGGFDIEFVDSHARHKLQPDHPEYGSSCKLSRRRGWTEERSSLPILQRCTKYLDVSANIGRAAARKYVRNCPARRFNDQLDAVHYGRRGQEALHRNEHENVPAQDSDGRMHSFPLP